MSDRRRSHLHASEAMGSSGEHRIAQCREAEPPDRIRKNDQDQTLDLDRVVGGELLITSQSARAASASRYAATYRSTGASVSVAISFSSCRSTGERPGPNPGKTCPDGRLDLPTRTPGARFAFTQQAHSRPATPSSPTR